MGGAKEHYVSEMSQTQKSKCCTNLYAESKLVNLLKLIQVERRTVVARHWWKEQDTASQRLQRWQLCRGER
jgi:hypothetical protein